MGSGRVFRAGWNLVFLGADMRGLVGSACFGSRTFQAGGTVAGVAW